VQAGKGELFLKVATAHCYIRPVHHLAMEAYLGLQSQHAVRSASSHHHPTSLYHDRSPWRLSGDVPCRGCWRAWRSQTWGGGCGGGGRRGAMGHRIRPLPSLAFPSRVRVGVAFSRGSRLHLFYWIQGGDVCPLAQPHLSTKNLSEQQHFSGQMCALLALCMHRQRCGRVHTLAPANTTSAQPKLCKYPYTCMSRGVTTVFPSGRWLDVPHESKAAPLQQVSLQGFARNSQPQPYPQQYHCTMLCLFCRHNRTRTQTHTTHITSGAAAGPRLQWWWCCCCSRGQPRLCRLHWRQPRQPGRGRQRRLAALRGGCGDVRPAWRGNKWPGVAVTRGIAWPQRLDAAGGQPRQRERTAEGRA
jgi:hypothetical protein